MSQEKQIDFLGKKFVEITMKVVIEYDANEEDIEDVVTSVVTCFYSEDTFGNETFIPLTETMKIYEYDEKIFEDVTERFTNK
jgi:hypothetical protein